MKNRYFGRKFHSKIRPKNDQISEPEKKSLLHCTFSDSVGDNYLLTEVAVTFKDSSSTQRKRSTVGSKRNHELRSVSSVFRVKRSGTESGTVIATPEIIVEHLKTTTTTELVTYIAETIQAHNNDIVSLGYTLSDHDTRITHSSSDAMLSGSSCRTGTQSAISGAETCDLCTSYEGCFSHGSCVAGACLCVRVLAW